MSCDLRVKQQNSEHIHIFFKKWTCSLRKYECLLLVNESKTVVHCCDFMSLNTCISSIPFYANTALLNIAHQVLNTVVCNVHLSSPLTPIRRLEPLLNWLNWQWKIWLICLKVRPVASQILPPHSKHFLWALSEMDMGDKSKGFREMLLPTCQVTKIQSWYNMSFCVWHVGWSESCDAWVSSLESIQRCLLLQN